jgi:hypothetical protein
VTLNSYKFLLVAMNNMLQFQCISHLVAIVPIMWILKGNDIATDILDQLKLIVEIISAT